MNSGDFNYKKEKLRTAAANMREKIERLNKNLNRLDEICENVKKSWKDNAASKVYISKIEEKRANMTALVAKYTELADILENNAKRIENDQTNMADGGGRL